MNWDYVRVKKKQKENKNLKTNKKETNKSIFPEAQPKGI
jgi:hypothetical protein